MEPVSDRFTEMAEEFFGSKCIARVLPAMLHHSHAKSLDCRSRLAHQSAKCLPFATSLQELLLALLVVDFKLGLKLITEAKVRSRRAQSEVLGIHHGRSSRYGFSSVPS